MEGDNAGGSSSTTTKRPQSIDKFGTTLIQNVYRYFKAIEDYGPRPTDQVAFSKFGKQNVRHHVGLPLCFPLPSISVERNPPASSLFCRFSESLLTPLESLRLQ